jgi:hypothetical protein
MDYFIAMLVGGLIGGLVGGIAANSQTHQIKIEAVKRGAAIWQVDENGVTTFTWK